MHLRKKVAVGVLGATGCVGQRMVALLDKHPWFELVAVAASDKSAGKKYKDAAQWMMPTPMPKRFQDLEVCKTSDELPCKIVFSALDAACAASIETDLAGKGYVVISNTKCHRMDPDVPLFIPEVNPEHLGLIKAQKFPTGGMIVTNPNCAVIGLSLALCPLHLEFGVVEANIVTLQASSGAGIPGVPSMALLDNVIPYIADEELKIETEPKKIFGALKNSHIEPSALKVSASVNRVPITEGHLEVVSIRLQEKASMDQVIRAWRDFTPAAQEMGLPSSPSEIIHYFDEEVYPQPKLHRDLGKGMAISIGRLRPCSLFDYKFYVLSHNTIRGGAGGTLLIGEYLVKNGFVYW